MNRTRSIKVRSFSFVLAVLMVLTIIPMVVSASVKVPDSSVDLYYLTESAAQQLTLPSGYKTEYQINATGSSSGYTYRVISGNSVKVSDSGLVTPATHQTTVISLATGTSRVQTSYSPGESTVRVTSVSDNTYTDIKFTVRNYQTVYCESVMDNIIADIITPGMTIHDKAVAITKYTAENYDYNASYSSATSMITYGGGDCWASCDMIVSLCEKCGLDAWVRNGNRDPGAGSGHRNVLVSDPGNNCWYECEAGYSGSKPRGYYVSTRTTLFSYRSTSNGVIVYQYDGEVPANFTIPSTINGKNVIGIEESFIHSDNIKTLTLPSTLQSIGNFAFSSCTSLESVTIPASVTSIGNGVFAKCSSLKTLSVASGNSTYCSTGNAIYTTGKKVLVAAPNVSSISIPSTVTSIAPYAFYYNSNIKSITIPSSVTEIGEGAFGNCNNLESLIIEGNSLKKIDNFAFAYTYDLKSVELPSSISTVGNAAFYYAGTMKVAIPGSSAPTVTADDGTVGSITLSSSDNVTFYVKSGATGFGDNWKPNGATIVTSSDPVAAMRAAVAAEASSSGNGSGSSGSSGSGSGNSGGSGGSGSSSPGSGSATPTPKPTSSPTFTPSSEPGVAGFVERLYTVALGRPSDPAGKADWIDRVTTQGYTGADLAEGFLYSDEFLSKGLGNSEFLDVMYATFFNRATDEGGKNNWLNAMAAGMSKKQVIRGFIDSTEWANLCLTYGIMSGGNGVPNITIQPSAEVRAFVTRLYSTCLGRDGDSWGMNDWSNKLANMQISGSVCAHGFFFSDEFTGQALSNDEYVTRLYRTFMNREPDPAGFADWTGRLTSGATREDVFQGFAGSAEWALICADYGIIK